MRAEARRTVGNSGLSHESRKEREEGNGMRAEARRKFGKSGRARKSRREGGWRRNAVRCLEEISKLRVRLGERGRVATMRAGNLG